MGQSLILLIEELAQGMTEAFAAVNDGFAALEQSWNLPLVLDAGLFDDPTFYALPEIDLVRYMVFNVENAADNLTLEIPSLTNGNTTYRLIAVANRSDTYTITVSTDDPGSTVDVPPLATRLIHVVSTDVNVISEGAYVTGFPLLIDGFTWGGPPAHLTFFEHYAVTDNAVIPENFDTSVAVTPSGELPTLPVRIRVSVNETPMGWFNIETDGSYSGEFADPGDFSIFAGDAMKFEFLTPEWATIDFLGTADDSDALQIYDGNATEIFVFGSGADGTVDKGASATDSASNLADAINASSLEVTAFADGTSCIVRNDFDGLGGSIDILECGKVSFAQVADAAGDDITFDDNVNSPTTFTFGDGTGGTINRGATAANSASALKTAINALTGVSLNCVAYLSTSTLLLVVNTDPAEVGNGAITKNDADNDYVVTDFAEDTDDFDITPFAVDTTASNIGVTVKARRV